MQFLEYYDTPTLNWDVFPKSGIYTKDRILFRYFFFLELMMIISSYANYDDGVQENSILYLFDLFKHEMPNRCISIQNT